MGERPKHNRILPRIAASRASWIKSCTEDTSLFARDFFTTTTELSLGKNLPWNIWRNSCIWWMKGRRLGWRECVRPLGEGLDARVFFSFTWFSLFLSFPSLPYDRWPNHPPISSHRIIPLHSHNCKFPFFWCIIKHPSLIWWSFPADFWPCSEQESQPLSLAQSTSVMSTVSTPRSDYGLGRHLNRGLTMDSAKKQAPARWNFLW